MSELRNAGLLILGARSCGTLHFAWPDGTPILSVGLTVDLCDPDNAWISLQHHCPGELPSEPYRLAAVFVPHCGGRWAVICPVLGVASPRVFCALVDGCPAERFASSGLRLVYPSDRYAASHRTLRHLQRLQNKADAHMTAHPAKGGYRGARGMDKATIARMNAEIAAADAAVWRQSLAETAKQPDAGRRVRQHR
jgi:hypothetical protein